MAYTPGEARLPEGGEKRVGVARGLSGKDKLWRCRIGSA
jgi:hypothetical protein